jgi:hypothetical protein
MFFSGMIPGCTKCKKSRVEVTLSQVFLQSRPAVEKMCTELTAAGLQVGQLVYCKTCDDYSVLSGWNAF